MPDAATTTPRPVALVTGASGGIGLELAKCFAADRYHLVLVARSTDRLAALASQLQRAHGVTASVIACDLSQPGAATVLADALAQRRLPIDVLVNNAGVPLYGPFVESDLRAVLGMMQLNMISLTHLTHLLLPGMVARRRGRILNVASTAAFQPGPMMAVYYATKAYVLSLSEALAFELRGSGVTVTALCPGPTRTGFQARAGLHGSLLLRMLMDPADVARAGYRAMQQGRALVVPGLINKLLAFSVRVFPRRLTVRLAHLAQQNRA